MDNVSVGFCGVCCSHCGMQTRIPKMAVDLQRFVEAYRYSEWIGYITRDFDFTNFLKDSDGLHIQAAKDA